MNDDTWKKLTVMYIHYFTIYLKSVSIVVHCLEIAFIDHP